MHASFPQLQTVRQLAQMAILIQTAAAELSEYELFFGAETVGYMREGAASMVRVMGEVMSGPSPVGEGLTRELRHDLRNHVAVVKGFSDLILMDLPWGHGARPMLERLSAKSLEFVRLLDHHRNASQGPDCRALAS